MHIYMLQASEVVIFALLVKIVQLYRQGNWSIHVHVPVTVVCCIKCNCCVESINVCNLYCLHVQGRNRCCVRDNVQWSQRLTKQFALLVLTASTICL